MNIGNARIWTENARVHLYAWRAYFGATLAHSDDIRKHLPAPPACATADRRMPSRQAGGHVLTPGRYVGAEAAEEDLPAPSAARQAGGEPFEDKMTRLAATLRDQQKEAAKLDVAIAANLKELGYGG